MLYCVMYLQYPMFLKINNLNVLVFNRVKQPEKTIVLIPFGI